MPSIYNLASPLYPQGNLLPFAHDSVTRLWKANLQTILTSMSRAGDGVILMTEVSSLLPDSAYVQEIKPSGLRKLAFQGSKDRKKPVLIFPTTFSPRSRSLPRFSARGNLFRTIHSERLIWKAKEALLLDKIPATKKKKKLKWLFILLSKLFRLIPIGQLKIKVVIYSCHHFLKRLQQQG